MANSFTSRPNIGARLWSQKQILDTRISKLTAKIANGQVNVLALPHFEFVS